MIFKNRRNEFEIIHQLLSFSLKGIKKTRLMYQTNMSYSQFTEYLSCLLEKGFLEPRKGNPHGTYFFTTEKGKTFLESLAAALQQAK
ncbi:MAG: winged helix-turn-helix domain-containing protein [Candidatus Thermoplasmatota archaeon]